MNMQASFSRTLLALFLSMFVGLFGLIITPQAAFAQNAGESANAMCNPVIPPCGCHQIQDPMTGQCTGGSNMNQCPCMATVNNVTVTGTCVAPNKCEAKKANGQGVDSGLGQLGQMVSQMMQQLMQMAQQGGGGGGGGGQGQGQGQQGGGMGGTGSGLEGSGCTSYYQVSQPSSDPCAYYLPNVSADLNNSLGLGAEDDLQAALNGTATVTATATANTASTGSAASTPANSLVGLITDSNRITIAPAGEVSVGGEEVVNSKELSFFGKQADDTATKAFEFSTIARLISGIKGDVTSLGDGATIVSSGRDIQSNTAVSGFFGADTVTGAGEGGVAGWLCRTRPWANSLFSRLFSASFFDDLCMKRGYQVGEDSASTQKAPTLTQTTVRASGETVTTSSTKAPAAPAEKPKKQQTVPATVDIWAVPAIVPIGSRTSVFWNAQYVESCIVTSPDGSFNQTALSGGASTVPLTKATTYSISCLDFEGTPVTDYFTVKMAI